MTEKEAIRQIQLELYRAETLHPNWPEDLIHQVAILAEESGEAVKAALDHVDHGESLDDVEKELIQTGAMVIRCLVNLRG